MPATCMKGIWLVTFCAVQGAAAASHMQQSACLYIMVDHVQLVAELRSWVKVKVTVLDSLPLIVLIVSMDVKQH